MDRVLCQEAKMTYNALAQKVFHFLLEVNASKNLTGECESTWLKNEREWSQECYRSTWKHTWTSYMDEILSSILYNFKEKGLQGWVLTDEFVKCISGKLPQLQGRVVQSQNLKHCKSMDC